MLRDYFTKALQGAPFRKCAMLSAIFPPAKAHECTGVC